MLLLASGLSAWLGQTIDAALIASLVGFSGTPRDSNPSDILTSSLRNDRETSSMGVTDDALDSGRG